MEGHLNPGSPQKGEHAMLVELQGSWHLITRFQNAFAQGGLIYDNIMLAYEIFNSIRKRNKGKNSLNCL